MDTLVAEMSSARSVEEARQRAARLLQTFEQAVLAAEAQACSSSCARRYNFRLLCSRLLRVQCWSRKWYSVAEVRLRVGWRRWRQALPAVGMPVCTGLSRGERQQ